MISLFLNLSLLICYLLLTSLFSQTKPISKTPVEKSKKQLLEEEIYDLQNKKDNLQKNWMN